MTYRAWTIAFAAVAIIAVLWGIKQRQDLISATAAHTETLQNINIYIDRIYQALGMAEPARMAGHTNVADLSTLRPSWAGATPKLGGEFEFLGTADKGDPAFDGHPPAGVVKVYHLPAGIRPGVETGEPTRAGFYRCPPGRFEAFKRANTAWNGSASWGRYDTIGAYPIAYTIIVPYKD
jgi:hypothetical protein